MPRERPGRKSAKAVKSLQTEGPGGSDEPEGGRKPDGGENASGTGGWEPPPCGLVQPVAPRYLRRSIPLSRNFPVKQKTCSQRRVPVFLPQPAQRRTGFPPEECAGVFPPLCGGQPDLLSPPRNLVQENDQRLPPSRPSFPWVGGWQGWETHFNSLAHKQLVGSQGGSNLAKWPTCRGNPPWGRESCREGFLFPCCTGSGGRPGNDPPWGRRNSLPEKCLFLCKSLHRA